MPWPWFFRCSTGTTDGSMKPYKVQTCHGKKRRTGIVARSMKDLVKKACHKLGIEERHNLRLVLEDDATLIDSEDYFSELPAQTVLVLLTENETWQSSTTSPSHNLSLLLQFSRVKLSEEIDTLLDGKLSQDDRAILTRVSSSLKMTYDIETRTEDPDWFTARLTSYYIIVSRCVTFQNISCVRPGLEKSFKTKGDVMTELAKRRIRSYYYTALDYIKKDKSVKNDTANLEELKRIMTKFQGKLKENDYNGHYFSRGDCSYCDDKGWFRCEGLYDQADCDKGHMINPYGSREERIIFGTWNLDHRVEKSRQVLPSLVEATLKRPGGYDINWCYFYSLLFTRDNLRLVHIVCHDKSEHVNYKCDETQFYI